MQSYGQHWRSRLSEGLRAMKQASDKDRAGELDRALVAVAYEEALVPLEDMVEMGLIQAQVLPQVEGAILGSRIRGQKMSPEGSRLAESERGAWF